jgi:hypothetical protein
VLARKGWIEDLAPDLPPQQLLPITIRHTAAGWRQAARRGHIVDGLDPSRLPVGNFPLSVVPLDKVAAIQRQVPEGTVAIVVREERPPRPYRVTHMGIVILGAKGRRMVRHASTQSMRVVDEPLEHFVARHLRQRGWPVVGLAFWRIRDNSGHARTLLSPRQPPVEPVIGALEAQEPARLGSTVCSGLPVDGSDGPACRALGAEGVATRLLREPSPR